LAFCDARLTSLPSGLWDVFTIFVDAEVLELGIRRASQIVWLLLGKAERILELPSG